MVLTYTCTRKCYFLEAIRNPGDKIVLDSSIGDACPHLERTPSDEQLEMQVYTETNEKPAAVSVPKAEAKAVSMPKKKPSNGGKTK